MLLLEGSRYQPRSRDPGIIHAMDPTTLAPPMGSIRVMANTVDEWCRLVWPDLSLRPRTVLQVAISRMEKGYELEIPISYPTEWPGMPENTELVYHGANPRALHKMLPNTILPSRGKEDKIGVWVSRADFTAYGYPGFLSDGEGVPVTENGPWVRVLLEAREHRFGSK